MTNYKVIRAERVNCPYNVIYKGYTISVTDTVWGAKWVIRKHKNMLKKRAAESKNYPNYPEVYNTD